MINFLTNTEFALGKNVLNILKNLKIMVIGCGGVGGYFIESAVRLGIENIFLYDYDKICVTNINRQLCALNSTIDKYKVEVYKERILDINSKCNVTIINKKLTESNLFEIFDYNIDFIIDAIDDINIKEQLIYNCYLKKINFISSMGMGNRIDATRIKISTLDKTFNDPVSKIIRTKLNKKKVKLKKIPIVFSDEHPLKCKEKNIISSVSYVPSIAGLLMLNYLVNRVIKDYNENIC